MNKDTKDNNYIKSNNIIEVGLNKFSSLYYINLLKANETNISRYKLSLELIKYISTKFKIEIPCICIADKPQPCSKKEAGTLKSKTFGKYRRSTKTITIYNLTSVKNKPISIKVFISTLLHEFMHHYDFEYLHLDNSLHTLGFYKRINDLQMKLK